LALPKWGWPKPTLEIERVSQLYRKLTRLLASTVSSSITRPIVKLEKIKIFNCLYFLGFLIALD